MMVRFKVVRASKLLFYLAAGIFVLVLGVLVARYVLSSSNSNDSINSAANYVRNTESQALTDDFPVKPSASKSFFINTSSSSIIDQPAFVSDSNLQNDSFDFNPDVEGNIQIEIVSEVSDAALQKRILIYHTHTHEAYEQVSNDPYVALEAWRTKDADHSVVRVGNELTQLLLSYGFCVVHDKTDHEGDELSTAYSRSLKTLESYEEKFDLYIDLHRDAYCDGAEIVCKGQNGKELAPIMMLIGNGEGFDEKPYYEENYTFARKLTQRINQQMSGLCKEVMVKDGRYNQHIGIFSILIEVGHNKNTLQQALDSIPPLAKAIYSLLIEKPDLSLTQIIETQNDEWNTD